MADVLKILAVVDILIGVLVFILQGVFYGLGYIGTVVFASTGFWGGILFISTGANLLRRIRLRNSIMGVAIASFFSALFMIGLFSWGISYDFSGGYCGNMCDAYAIEITFLVSGILAVIVNIAVIVKAKDLPAFILPPQTQYVGQTVTVINTAQQPYQVSGTAVIYQGSVQQQQQYPMQPGNVVYSTQYPSTNNTYQVQQVMTNPNGSSVNYQLPPTAYQPNQMAHPNVDQPPSYSK